MYIKQRVSNSKKWFLICKILLYLNSIQLAGTDSAKIDLCDLTIFYSLMSKSDVINVGPDFKIT